MLLKAGVRQIINDLSPELRERLETERAKLGKIVKFRFDISHRNPDPEKTNGERLLPAAYTLTPVTFFINDKGKKRIGLAVDQLNDHGDAAGFKSIILRPQHKALLVLNMDGLEAQDIWAYLMLHPKNRFSWFPSDTEEKVFEYVDEVKDAKKKSESRKLKAAVMEIATNFTRQELKDFASAIGWDEDMDPDLLEDKIQDLAEKDPHFFQTFYEKKNYKLRALLTRAENYKVVAWNPLEFKYTWGNTGETVCAFGRQEGLDRLEKFAEWLITDKTGPEIIEKIKSMIKVLTKSVPA